MTPDTFNVSNMTSGMMCCEKLLGLSKVLANHLFRFHCCGKTGGKQESLYFISEALR
jgi:hypothetical protein